MRYILLKDGFTFSQRLLTTSEELLTDRLGDEGYAFAEVEGLTEINDEEGSVAIKLYLKPGKRTYVRRITFTGNKKTSDEVLRREMRQMEGAVASSRKIKQSQVRLASSEQWSFDEGHPVHQSSFRCVC